MLRWSEQPWERNWQVVSRRLIGAPAILAESPEFQAIKTQLDRTFIAGDARAFAEAGCQLIELCEQIVARDGIALWW